MIDLNILSPERQASIRGRIFYSLIERIFVILVLLALIGSLILLGMKIRLSDNLSTVRSRQLLATQYVNVNQKINDLNRSIARIETLQMEVVPASLLIEDLTSRIPEGIHISNMNFETATKSVKLSGHADTREQLLMLEGALLESPYLTDLDFPLSNLFQKTDLFFSFSALLDVDRLKAALEPTGPEEHL